MFTPSVVATDWPAAWLPGLAKAAPREKGKLLAPGRVETSSECIDPPFLEHCVLTTFTLLPPGAFGTALKETMRKAYLSLKWKAHIYLSLNV